MVCVGSAITGLNCPRILNLGIPGNWRQNIDILPPYNGMMSILRSYARNIWKKDIEIKFLATWRKEFYDKHFEDRHREGFLIYLNIMKDNGDHAAIKKIRITEDLSNDLFSNYHPDTEIIDVNLGCLANIAEVSQHNGQYPKYLNELLKLRMDRQQDNS